MFGVSSRTVLAALREIFEHRMGVTPEEVGRYKELLSSSEGGTVVAEYKEFTIDAVQKAFLKSHDDLARQMFNDYLKEARFYMEQKAKFVRSRTDLVRDELTGRPKVPNVKFLREVEQHVPISESEADNYRAEMLYARNITYDTYSPLARAVEKKLLSDSKDMLKTVLAIHKSKDEETKKRANDLFSELTGPGGFCNICAKEIIEKADEFLNE